MAPHNDIIFFHYEFSPYARRVICYLQLRGIDYAECIQPVYLPREDLNALGVKYRRIPLMSIGRDIYCDTRLILQKLEERFPKGALGAAQSDQKAIEKLLEIWTIDGGIFARAAQSIPLKMPLMSDPKFLKDREDYTGTSWSQGDIADVRPEAITHLRDGFAFLENGLLADGREWILRTEKPTLADIEAIWPFHWILSLPNAFPSTLVSGETFPRVFAWIDRFNGAIRASKSTAPKPEKMQGAGAVKHVTQADFAEPDGPIDENDPLKLKKGQDVECWPIDSGSLHHDRGRLVSLTPKEVVLAAQSKVGGREVHIHYPRWNTRIRAVGGREGAKL